MSRTPVPQTYENGLPWDRLGDVARPSPGLRMKVSIDHSFLFPDDSRQDCFPSETPLTHTLGLANHLFVQLYLTDAVSFQAAGASPSECTG